MRAARRGAAAGLEAGGAGQGGAGQRGVCAHRRARGRGRRRWRGRVHRNGAEALRGGMPTRPPGAGSEAGRCGRWTGSPRLLASRDCCLPRGLTVTRRRRVCIAVTVARLRPQGLVRYATLVARAMLEARPAAPPRRGAGGNGAEIGCCAAGARKGRAHKGAHGRRAARRRGKRARRRRRRRGIWRSCTCRRSQTFYSRRVTQPAGQHGGGEGAQRA